MAGTLFLRFWLNYFDNTRDSIKSTLEDLITKLETPGAVVSTDELLTSMLRIGYNSTVGAWDALVAATGSSIPTISLPPGNGPTAVIAIAIDDFVAAKLDRTALYAIDGSGTKIPVEKIDVHYDDGELTATLVNGPWPAGTFLGAVLYDGRSIALVFTQR